MLHRQWINIYRTANESARTPSACECSSGSGTELATALTVSISAQVTEAAGGTGNTPASDCRGGTRTHGRCEVLFSVCSGLTQRLVSWSEMWRFTQQLSSLTVSSGRIKQKFCEASKLPLFWPLSHFSSSHFRLKLICRIKICNPKLHFQIEKLQNVNVKTEPLLLCLSPTGASLVLTVLKCVWLQELIPEPDVSGRVQTSRIKFFWIEPSTANLHDLLLLLLC